ncbi:MAG: aminotransferase class V-fold PLP-dependent enzyme [Ignavibacteriales bacterium]|nr:aminotransferase class V-fold PLP-dependent enzyme [Ignavibacteriales bacterium]
MDPQVFEAMRPYFLTKFGNASSKNHSFGWEANSAVEFARKQMARLLMQNQMKLFLLAEQLNQLI